MKLPNFGYHFAFRSGRFQRKAYRRLLPVIVSRQVSVPRSIPLDVYSYSGEEMLAEQVRSIRSFLRYAGRPKSFTVVSDGSHSERSIVLLRKIDPLVLVRRSGENLPPDLPEKFRRYVTSHFTGKQLGLALSLPSDRPALYVDSDVLFFPGAADLIRDITDREAPARYLLDCQEFSADPRLFRGQHESKNPVNAGVILFFRPLDWSLGITRFLELEGDPNFFTNQTIVHLVMHANGARPLDPQRYVLQLDDQCIYPDRYAGRQIVLRHYVNPVRHKFWNTHR